MEHIDYEAIIRLQNNDKKALDILYRQYSHKIYLNVFKLTKDRSISQDIVHDVYIKLWEKRGTIDPSRPILNWIFVVSYHKAVDYLKVSLKTSLECDSILPDVHRSDQDEINLGEQQWSLIERAIQELSPQKRRVFELCKLQGKTYEHTAQELQISKHTVKEYLSAAMKNVKQYIKAAEVV